MSNTLDNETVYCPECSDKKPMKQITHKHLKKHNITIEQFKIKYPNCFLIHPNKEEKLKEKRKEAKNKKDKLLIEKPCWNYKNCNNKVLVNINVGYKNTTCSGCREKNLFHPDVIKNKQRLSKQAKKINKDFDIISKRTKSILNRNEEEKKQTRIKRRQTMKKKYGSNWRKLQFEKTKQSMLKNHGFEFALQIDKFKKQAQKTTFEKYGVEHIMKDPNVVDKIFTKRNQEEITKNTIITNIKKYGGNSPMCDINTKKKAEITRSKNFIPRFNKFLETVDLVIQDEYVDCYTYNTYYCKKCKNTFKSNWNQIQQGRLCSSCQNKFKPSNGENEIFNFLQSIGINNILRNDRNLIKPYEIDLLLPEQKICIEYCGLYTHREDVLKSTRRTLDDHRYYHIYKLDSCLKHNYILLTIFEDEWLFKTHIVKEMLKQKLMKNNCQKINARDCKISIISPNIKRDFLNSYHIQGNDKSQVMLGAFSKEDILVAVMTFSKPNISKGQKKQLDGYWELNRFCTNYNYRIPGVAGKLLKHFQRNYNWFYIYSFADRRWSTGNLYFKLNFNLESNIEKIIPNYWYLDQNNLKRMHRFALRKTNKDNTILTEKMYRIAQGYGIIYDCGNLKFSIKK